VVECLQLRASRHGQQDVNPRAMTSITRMQVVVMSLTDARAVGYVIAEWLPVPSLADILND